MADTMPRRRTRDAELTQEQRAALEEVRARHRTPEARAEAARVREAVRQEFPPLTADEDLLELLATLRAARERQGLSLADVSERTGMDRSMVSRLELGKIPNPTLQTLRAYSRALGIRVTLGVDALMEPEVFKDGYGRAYITVGSKDADDFVTFLQSNNVTCVCEPDQAGPADKLRTVAVAPDTDVRRLRLLVEQWLALP